MPTINTTFLNQGTYSGRSYSNVYDVPASSGSITATIDATLITQPTQSVTVGAEISKDGGATWTLYASIGVVGAPVRTGSKGDPNKPMQTVNFTFAQPVKVRAFCEVVGGSLSFLVTGKVVYA